MLALLWSLVQEAIGTTSSMADAVTLYGSAKVLTRTDASYGCCPCEKWKLTHASAEETQAMIRERRA